MGQKLFRPGQAVVWGQDSGMMKLVTGDDLGPGPFKICTVEEVPNNCDCGAQMRVGGRLHVCRYKRMGYGKPLREHTGHPQWVTIDDGSGKPLATTKLNGEKQVYKFSGRYFKAA